MHRLALALTCAAVVLPAPAPAKAASAPVVVASRLAAPWGVAFLPDGSALVTERDSGRILQVTPGRPARQVYRVTEADGAGEGGLLGIAVGPGFARDRAVFIYYTTAGDNRIARFRLGSPARPAPIRTGIPVSGIHNGGRLVFGPDGHLYAGTGDASRTGRSQDRRSLGGKVLRMTTAGRPAPGNPFPGSVVWSLGHRNVQGLAFDRSGRLWATEFGQNRTDEVNLIVKGGNYGWPAVEGRSAARRFRGPAHTWTPSEASPSGLAFHDDQLYAAALRGRRLWRLPVSGTRIGPVSPLYSGTYGRLRDVAVNPRDGSVWLLTSNRDGRGDPSRTDDRVLRIDDIG